MDQSSNPLPHDTGDCSLIDFHECLTGVDRFRGVSEWVEIYANDDVFKAHLANEKGKGPLGAIVEACSKITCRCWGDPDADSREILAGFEATYHETAESSFALHHAADGISLV